MRKQTTTMLRMTPRHACLINTPSMTSCSIHAMLCTVFLCLRVDRMLFFTCSIHAALNNKVACLEALLNAGADTHATTTSGDTALHWAAYKAGHV